MTDTDALNENATIAAVSVGGAIIAADKLGFRRARKAKESLEKKAEEWQEWKRKHPKLIAFYGYFDSILTAVLQYTDLITDVLAVLYFLRHNKVWYAFWMSCFTNKICS